MKKKLYALPGFMTDVRLWKELKKEIDHEYEIIHMEIPVKKSFDEIVDTLNENLDEGKLDILGFSLGGYTAIYFACKYPSRVNRLMVSGCTASSMVQEEIEKRRQLIKMTDEMGLKGLSKRKIHTLIDESNFDNNELIELIQNMYRDAGFHTFITHLGVTLDRIELGDKLIDSSIDTYFVYSNKDRLVSQNWMDDFKSRAKNIKFKKIDSSSHFVPLEKSKELSSAIKEFF